MSLEEAIKLIERLLIKHRQTHADWLNYFIKNPKAEQKYVSSAGNRLHQEDCIAAYDEALEAVKVLREKDNEEIERLRGWMGIVQEDAMSIAYLAGKDTAEKIKRLIINRLGQVLKEERQ